MEMKLCSASAVNLAELLHLGQKSTQPGGFMVAINMGYDTPMCKRTNNILAKLLRNLRNAETENKNLKLELSKLKAKGRALWIVLALSWIMVFVLLFEYARRNQGAPNFRMLE
ncbi:hypothetical protein ACH5RR_037573 [Cinchona calisaya]|uniref:Uncharacterized protein n=1 Tax=Cinchona calisaya TaxID=153742 RepID=A0ABD2YAA3_9GENT